MMYYWSMATLCAVVATTVGPWPSLYSDLRLWYLHWPTLVTYTMWSSVGVGLVYIFHTYVRARKDCRPRSEVEQGFQRTPSALVSNENPPAVESPPPHRLPVPVTIGQTENVAHAMFPELCEYIVRYCIWPRIFADRVPFTEKTRQIARMRSVCRSWRIWIESTSEYSDHREAWVEDMFHQDFLQQGIEYSSSD